MYARPIRIALRTAHIIAFAALYGGHLYAAPAASLRPALYATLATGAALIGLDGLRSPIWFVQIRGLATMLKIVLVALVALYWDSRVALLTAVIVIGAVSSHMPGRFRYFSVVHGRVAGDRESG